MATRRRYMEFFYVGSPSNSVQYFEVPYNVSCVHVTMVGGGGGGGSSRNASSQLAAASGGGSAEFCINVPVYVQPSSSVAVVVGEGGAGATRPPAQGSTGRNGQDGGYSSFGTWLRVAGGGKGFGSGGGNVPGGSGGGPGGATGTTSDGTAGSAENGARGMFGGSAGGGYLHNSNRPSRRGGPCAGVDYTPSGIAGSEISPSSVNAGGGAGASSMWGFGGAGGDCGNPPADDANGDDANPLHYGAGGGGGGTDFKTNAAANAFANKGFGGDGAPGYVLVTWLEDDAQGGSP